MSVHVQGARQARQARNALDAFGHATLVVRAADGKVVWKTPLARDLLLQHFDGGELDDAVLAWVREELARRAVAGAVPGEPLKLSRQNRRLVLALHEQTGEDEWLIVMRESSDQAVIDAVGAAFRLTTREAEVLYWVAKGKISRDIADILSMSPATVKKHLEHIYEKLGVETRTAAAGLAMSRVRGLSG
jgi:DNA-binding CsgD family transcriptional regulator